MATEIVMPKMGYDMREGKIIRWLKKEGDAVARGEAVAEIESEKATLEVEAFASGILTKIYVAEGATVPVGDVLAVIGAADEAIPERPGRVGVSGAVAQAAPSRPAETAKTPAREPSEERVRATPVAHRLAEERGVDLHQVKGTGPGGRIGKEDVEAYVAQAPAPAPTVAPAPVAAPQAVSLPGIFIPAGLTPMRQAIARRMSLSKPGAPHYYITVEAEMTAAMELRRELNAELRKEEDRISVNDMIIKASVLALRKHMEFNVFVLPEGIQPQAEIVIGIAVALEEGLIAPAIPGSGTASLLEIARASRDVAERARQGRLRPEEYAGGTFAISNLGMYDVERFMAIVTPPNASALAVGSIRQKPVVKDNQIVVAQVMVLTLSADHRATDGAQGAQFLVEIKRYLERPSLLLL
ncbi:MAG: 2-oxo acid dehydrogenase subunit E2 [Chloroflexi bacterium]|nr:2-oxo acid dehydrogenase subunit E2 [Chloroflexota bacterium]